MTSRQSTHHFRWNDRVVSRESPAGNSIRSNGAREQRSNSEVEFPWSRRAGSAKDNTGRTDGAHITNGPDRLMTFGRFTPLNELTADAQGDNPSQPPTRRSSSTLDDSIVPSTNIDLPRLQAASEARIPTAAATRSIVDQTTDLFGVLPDPIRLHEQLGEFDGQVIFIGHPNRDITAHQWSNTSFQWENIGRYAHVRGKIEGSLASDRLKDSNPPLSSLEYFRLVAKAREQRALDHTGADTDYADSNLPKRTSPTCRPVSWTQSKVGPGTALPSVRDQIASLEASPKSSGNARIRQANTTGLAADDDPFITNLATESMLRNTANQSQTQMLHMKGSLDLHYRFPTRSIVSPTVQTKSATASNPRSRTLPTLQNLLTENQNVERKKATESRQTAENRHIHHAMLRMSQPQPTARSLFPQPGLTVANPHRVNPLSHRVAGDTEVGPSWPDRARLEPTSDIETSKAALHFSDPDARRQAQASQIVNGIGKQRSSVQNWLGPFVAQTQPISYDLAISLSAQSSEKAKLAQWYGDGQRVARQEENARALINAAAADGHDRYVGTISEANRAMQYNPQGNTFLFLRLFENLSEYVEERKRGKRSCYFTRAWKTPSSDMIDPSPEGLNSFFGESMRPS